MPVLETKNLGIAFGGLQALQDVHFSIEKGEIFGLIGPNGAGKTTVFNLLTNVYVPTEGVISLDGVNIVGKKTYQITQNGIARTFQNIRLFKDISVIDNVKIAMNYQMKYSVLSGIFRLPSYWKEEKAVTERAYELLKVFHLEEHADDLAKNLPYGQQRKLEIARALAANPKVLLLDEPAAGMNPTETKELMETIALIRDKFKVAVLLIEHDMNFVMGICEHIVVLDYGRIIAEGSAEEVRSNPKVIAAYLGGE
ncbi:ABC transporter ATP-binding protein [Caproiciproducens galactitolivorans]|uniref:Lipopolysaccharide export system ATP-binding protein LptB n=1 Tax=Caproiciproducens galactitolivorans TaxID=642589 RepID=A0A4Z0Y8E2_9FIRM|nr:ABC transporter ATP-binding protein [Caproiciproducens galactitolivorans]QEY34711.1 ABC transporter ATP-binding protein [Caproiciproducens galactitolivorans]TGJ75815.1 lipopolysaccharide export system ATP-binding protein LptB [Caproiciproducens galactitolivorans]